MRPIKAPELPRSSTQRHGGCDFIVLSDGRLDSVRGFFDTQNLTAVLTRASARPKHGFLKLQMVPP